MSTITDSKISDFITDSWLKDVDIEVFPANESSDLILVDIASHDGLHSAGIMLDRDDLDRLIVLLNTRRAEMGPAKS